MSMNKAWVAVVEDDPALNELLVEELEAEGYRVTHHGSVEDYLSQEGQPDVVVSDIRLPGTSMSLLQTLQQQNNPRGVVDHRVWHG